MTDEEKKRFAEANLAIDRSPDSRRTIHHPPAPDLRALQHEIHALNVSKGWWEDPVTRELDNLEAIEGVGAKAREAHRANTIVAKLALITTEVAEAIEEVRDGHLDARIENGKPEGLPVEIVDVIIRSLDLLTALGHDAGALIRHKLDYNRTRTHRHGGRVL